MFSSDCNKTITNHSKQTKQRGKQDNATQRHANKGNTRTTRNNGDCRTWFKQTKKTNKTTANNVKQTTRD